MRNHPRPPLTASCPTSSSSTPPNLEAADAPVRADFSKLCRALADVMLVQRDETGGAVFPPGGTRVLAYPAAHYAVADGQGDYAFVYLNLRMGRSRSELVQRYIGNALMDCTKAELAEVFAARPVGVTFQIDQGAEVFDGKHSGLHPLFA